MRTLIVDDRETNCRTLERTLQRWGMVCTSTNSPLEALCKLNQASAKGNPFTLLLTDYQMLEMNGFELVKRIREQGETDQLAVVMLSSSLLLADAGRARQLGVTCYLTKPIGRAELLDAVLGSLGETGAAPTPARSLSAADAPSLGPLRILLAEDNRVNQLVATRTLEKQGYQVTVAGNGNEVLQMHASDELKYDVILMDVQMPEMDGFETTQMIRQREKISGEHIPIIALTAHAMKGDRNRCLAVGMDGYVSKPIQFEELQRELQASHSARRACL